MVSEHSSPKTSLHALAAVTGLTSCYLAMILALFSASLMAADVGNAEPNKAYPPELVVSIIVKSLQSNDSADDAGIATVYRFASPANRASTGPLARFSNMIKRGYPDMLNHVRARYTPMKVKDDQAVQAVWLSSPNGLENGYAFQLSRQRGGEFDGMWMTDAVIPLGPGAQSGIRI